MEPDDGRTFGSEEEVRSLANCVPRAWATGAGKTAPRLLGKPRGGCISPLLSFGRFRVFRGISRLVYAGTYFANLGPEPCSDSPCPVLQLFAALPDP